MFNSLRAAYEPALEALAPRDGRGGRPGRRLPRADRRDRRGRPRHRPGRRRARAPPGHRPACSPPSRHSTRPVRRDDDQASPEIERLAAAAAGRRRSDGQITGAGPGAPTSRSATAWRSFWRHPSPWMISTFLARLGRRPASLVGGGSWWELVIPAALVALFPVIEWVIHVVRPALAPPPASARSQVDSLLARKHREHHADPRDIPLVFIPWQALAWLLPAYVVVALLAMPSLPSALSLLVSVYAHQVRLRVDPLPGAQRLPAAVAVVPLGVAQPPAAPLQERALLVHRDHRRHRRPPLRHLPRPGVGPDVARRSSGCTRPRAPSAAPSPRDRPPPQLRDHAAGRLARRPGLPGPDGGALPAGRARRRAAAGRHRLRHRRHRRPARGSGGRSARSCGRRSTRPRPRGPRSWPAATGSRTSPTSCSPTSTSTTPAASGDFPQARVHVLGDELDAALAPDAARAAALRRRPVGARPALAAPRGGGRGLVRLRRGAPRSTTTCCWSRCAATPAVTAASPSAVPTAAGCSTPATPTSTPASDRAGSTPPGLRAFQRLMAVDDRQRRHNQERLRELLAARGAEVTVFSAHDATELAALTGTLRRSGLTRSARRSASTLLQTANGRVSVSVRPAATGGFGHVVPDPAGRRVAHRRRRTRPRTTGARRASRRRGAAGRRGRSGRGPSARWPRWSPKDTAKASSGVEVGDVVAGQHRVLLLGGRVRAERVGERDAAARGGTSPPRARRPGARTAGSVAQLAAPSSATPETTRCSSAQHPAPHRAARPRPRPRGRPPPMSRSGAEREHVAVALRTGEVRLPVHVVLGEPVVQHQLRGVLAEHPLARAAAPRSRPAPRTPSGPPSGRRWSGPGTPSWRAHPVEVGHGQRRRGRRDQRQHRLGRLLVRVVRRGAGQAGGRTRGVGRRDGGHLSQRGERRGEDEGSSSRATCCDEWWSLGDSNP